MIETCQDPQDKKKCIISRNLIYNIKISAYLKSYSKILVRAILQIYKIYLRVGLLAWVPMNICFESKAYLELVYLKTNFKREG